LTSTLTTTLALQEQKLLACIHCGLCLEACPTYVATGDENDSPRGRIYLMRAVEEGRLAASSQSFRSHIDRCLGCRACEPVCPAGVEYGQLLEGARSELFNAAETQSFTQRLLRLVLRHVWLNPFRLQLAFSFSRLARDAGIAKLLLKSKLPRLISRRFEFALALLESSRPRRQTNDQRQPDSVSTADTGGLLLFKGCVTEGLFSRINQATARVLAVNGFTTQAPPAQVCCGALHAHAGDDAGARQLAKQNMEAFRDQSSAPIITNAGGCGAMLASYAHLFAGDQQLAASARAFSARVRDISQQLTTGEIKTGATIDCGKITYDASCHLINGQHAGEAPLRMLEAITDLDFAPLAGSERCCGGAGVYNLLEPELSGAVLNEKLVHIRATAAATLATGNPGCHMQIGAGTMLAGDSLNVCHPVELLDESYRRAGYYRKEVGMTRKSPNFITLAIFAPVLILAGIAGFLAPARLSLTSGATPYNVFHIFFGCVGLIILLSRKEQFVSLFNAGFGLIDLYQAAASFLHLPPEQYFLWTRVDDFLHIVIGLLLTIIGCYGLLKPR
jgi:glycolate oxidase iron-sulfur subunit